jgi:hypothetical protein
VRGSPLLKAGLLVVVFIAALAAQRGFREYPYEENNPAPVPPDANEKTEWAFARLRYTNSGGFGGGGFGGFRRGRGSGRWATDFPKADRQFVQGVRRLSRIHTRSAEQVVDLDLDDDEIFYWPWVYTLEVGGWNLSERHVNTLREYLLRGGFLMIDDFHGEYGWEGFVSGMQRIFPDRPIVEIDSKDPIFHVLYDLDERYPVAGIRAVQSGLTYEREDGKIPHWRGIYDDKGRIMVAITFNQDYGDAWEWADAPWYPEKMTSQAYRLGINYIIYSMTH